MSFLYVVGSMCIGFLFAYKMNKANTDLEMIYRVLVFTNLIILLFVIYMLQLNLEELIVFIDYTILNEQVKELIYKNVSTILAILTNVVIIICPRIWGKVYNFMCKRKERFSISVAEGKWSCIITLGIIALQAIVKILIYKTNMIEGMMNFVAYSLMLVLVISDIDDIKLFLFSFYNNDLLKGLAWYAILISIAMTVAFQMSFIDVLTEKKWYIVLGYEIGVGIALSEVKEKRLQSCKNNNACQNFIRITREPIRFKTGNRIYKRKL